MPFPDPEFVLYREEVFQVEWDPNHETVLASSADDRRLMVWDLNRYFTSEIADRNVLTFLLSTFYNNYVFLTFIYFSMQHLVD
jgi:WD40 repeat protein